MIARVSNSVEPFHRRVAVPGLLLLCLFTYLPGLLRMPAVDRTEVIWAESTRDMLARDALADPRFEGKVQAFRPIGTFWAQGISAAFAGDSHAHDIRVYRIPGLIAVTLTVLALYGLSLPLIGTWPAFLAAGLFAVAPLTALLSQLAIADGLALLPATVAMLALLRIYVAADKDDTRTLALLFWGALGLGMFFNALHTPILVVVTLIALSFFDRDFWWIGRLHPRYAPLAVLLAAPWLAVRFHQDGIPFSGLGFKKFLAALGGAQDMKLRAFPGTFLLAAVLGFLPGTALLYSGLKRLWDSRREKLARFLLAWVIGYIVYLELISSKPGTYTVQVMFPAMALAVAGLVADWREGTPAPAGHLIPSPVLALLFPLPPVVVVYAFGGVMPDVIAALLVAATAGLFYLSATAAYGGQPKRWAIASIAALSLFAIAVNGAVLPSIDRIWPTRQIERALEGCPAGRLAVLGFREPSAKFVLKSDATIAGPDALRAALVEGRATYIAGEARDNRLKTLNRSQYRRPRAIACVEAYNVMRGCPLFFTIVSTGDTASCGNRDQFPCDETFAARAEKVRENSSCD